MQRRDTTIELESRLRMGRAIAKTEEEVAAALLMTQVNRQLQIYCYEPSCCQHEACQRNQVKVYFTCLHRLLWAEEERHCSDSERSDDQG